MQVRSSSVSQHSPCKELQRCPLLKEQGKLSRCKADAECDCLTIQSLPPLPTNPTATRTSWNDHPASISYCCNIYWASETQHAVRSPPEHIVTAMTYCHCCTHLFWMKELGKNGSPVENLFMAKKFVVSLPLVASAPFSLIWEAQEPTKSSGESEYHRGLLEVPQ